MYSDYSVICLSKINNKMLHGMIKYQLNNNNKNKSNYINQTVKTVILWNITIYHIF